MKKKLELKQVLNNSLIIQPSEQETEMFGIQISEKNITGSSHGIVVAMSDNIKNMPKEKGNIEVGDDIVFRKNHAETILIEKEEYWFVPWESCIYIK